MSSLLDFLQAASNSAASNVSAPVDAIAWLLKKAGIDVGTPVGGSDWMEQRGLTKSVQQSGASVAGEALGLLAPMGAAAKAPQVAKGLLQAGENLAAPANVNRGLSSGQRGIVPGRWERAYHTTTNKPFDPKDFDLSMVGTSSGHASSAVPGMWASASPKVSSMYGFDKVTNRYPTNIFGPAGAGVKSISLGDVIPGANTMPLRVNVKNPKVLSAKEGQEMIFGKSGDDWREAGSDFAKFAAQAREDGFDSVIIKGNPMARTLEFRADQVLMFDPKTQAASLFK